MSASSYSKSLQPYERQTSRVGTETVAGAQGQNADATLGKAVVLNIKIVTRDQGADVVVKER